MKVVIIDGFGHGNIMEVGAIPPLGAQIDMDYKPNPKVKEVVMWPRKETLEQIKAEDFKIEALVLVA